MKQEKPLYKFKMSDFKPFPFKGHREYLSRNYEEWTKNISCVKRRESILFGYNALIIFLETYYMAYPIFKGLELLVE